VRSRQSQSTVLRSFPATFAGQSVDNTAVLVRLTHEGDANLDRKVDFSDLVVLSQNYSGTGKLYGEGDFNYDGKVDFADLVILSQNYNTTLVPPAGPLIAGGSLKEAKRQAAIALPA
jgi:hypothetical protein